MADGLTGTAAHTQVAQEGGPPTRFSHSWNCSSQRCTHHCHTGRIRCHQSFGVGTVIMCSRFPGWKLNHRWKSDGGIRFVVPLIASSQKGTKKQLLFGLAWSNWLVEQRHLWHMLCNVTKYVLCGWNLMVKAKALMVFMRKANNSASSLPLITAYVMRCFHCFQITETFHGKDYLHV